MLPTRVLQILIHHPQSRQRCANDDGDRHGEELQAEKFSVPGNRKQHGNKDQAGGP